MKTFYFKRDDGSLLPFFETITVGELKEVLSKYPDDMPCVATWEGIFTPIRKSKLYEKTEYRKEETVDYIYTEVIGTDQDCLAPETKCIIFDVEDEH